ncbi:MAG: phosphoribosyltransferase family protein [Bacteroidota bacterium]|jgi:pyrimidine operon attenuation protein/uracil phosphoribosyltransferase
MTNSILTHEQVQAKIKRLAAQVYECFCEQPQAFLMIGIQGNGEALAAAITEHLPLPCRMASLSINKKNPGAAPISLSIDAKDIPPLVVLVDDVCNTGSTLFYAAAGLLSHGVGTIKTVVLIDRYHRRFPISTDFVGLSLATTLQSHIRVEHENNQWLALLEN